MIEVEVKVIGGNDKGFSFLADGRMTIGQLKDIIREQSAAYNGHTTTTSSPSSFSSRQRLIYRGKQLTNDTLTIQDYLPSSTLSHMLVHLIEGRMVGRGRCSVPVNILWKEEVILEMHESETVYHIKKIMEERFGIRLLDQRLIFHGQHLDDNRRSIGSLELTERDKIHLFNMSLVRAPDNYDHNQRDNYDLGYNNSSTVPIPLNTSMD
eukprot:gene1427-1552_t